VKIFISFVTILIVLGLAFLIVFFMSSAIAGKSEEVTQKLKESNLIFTVDEDFRK
jgi:ABC-type lipoprotein release transport system permease subunit